MPSRHRRRTLWTGPARQVLEPALAPQGRPREERHRGGKMSLAILVVAHGRRARHCALATAWAIWLAIGGGDIAGRPRAPYRRHGRRGNGRAEETDGCANGAEARSRRGRPPPRLRSRRPRRRSIAPSACGPIAFGSTPRRCGTENRAGRTHYRLQQRKLRVAQGVGLHLTDGPALGGSEVLTATALNPQESIQWILPLVAPEATGSYTSTWQDAAGRRDALWQPHPAGHLRGKRHAPPRRRRSHRQRPR